MALLSKEGGAKKRFSNDKKARSFRKRPFCSAVIVGAGLSRRMDGEDKLFLEICGAPVLAHTLSAFQNSSCIDEIIVVTRAEAFQQVGALCVSHNIGKVSKILLGGETRLESVMNGMLGVSKKAKLIAVHDAARPCVGEAIISRTVGTAAEFYAAAPGIPVISTLKRVNGGTIRETVDRTDLVEIQTPQVFDADLIKAALTNAADKGADITDDCMAVELLGLPVHITEGSASNIKITTREDIVFAESILRNSR